MDGCFRATMTVSTCPLGSWTEEAWVSDRPDDVDAAFAEIVADLRREGVGRTIPDLDDLTDTSELPVADDPDSTPPGGFASGSRGLAPGDLPPRALFQEPDRPPQGDREDRTGRTGRFRRDRNDRRDRGTRGDRGTRDDRGARDDRSGRGDLSDRPRSDQPLAWRGHDGEWDWSWNTDDEHYVPPEPPPLPRLRPLTIVSLVLIVLGVVLLIIPTLIGLDARIATPIALLSITSGGGMLLLRARQNPKNPTDRDDGAQL